MKRTHFLLAAATVAVGCYGTRTTMADQAGIPPVGSSAGLEGSLFLTSHSTTSPTITGLFPSAAKVGDSITIAGYNFSTTAASNSIVFGGGTTATPSYADFDSLTVTVPSTASSGVVRVDVGEQSSNRFQFTVLASPPSVVSVIPNHAAPGTNVTLVGSGFSSSAMLNEVFFGSMAATVVSAEPTSLTVTVPATASNDYVKVVTGGNTSNKVFFRVGSPIAGVYFDRGVVGESISISGTGFGTSTGSVSFGGANAPIQSWSDTLVSVLVPTFAQSGPLVLSRSSGGETNWPGFSVLTGLPDFNTTFIGRFIGGHTDGWSARTRKYVYAAGGMTTGYPGSSSNVGVERAAINQDGTVGAFNSVSGVSLYQNNVYCTSLSEAIGPYFYIFGGDDPTGTTVSMIQRATIGSDESLSSFINAPVSLSKRAVGMTSVRLSSRVHIVGGYNSTDGRMNLIQSAVINSDGTLGNFSESWNQMTFPAYQTAGAAVGGYLYLFGGANASNYPQTTIQRATFDSSGNLGTFSNYSVSLPVALQGGKALVVGNYCYVIWGADGSVYRNYFYKSAIQPSGDLGPFALAGTTVWNHGRPNSFVLGGRLYIDGSMTGGDWLDVNNPAIELLLLK